MAEQDEDPEADQIDQESAVSLPERDALSIIGGPDKVIGIDGGVGPGPDPGPLKPVPIDNADV